MNKYFVLIGLAAALTAGQAAASIIGSPHDFSLQSWNTRQGVCSPCHTAHTTDPAQLVPLWAHATTASNFTPYTSPSMNATDAGQQPSGASKACLSCHDGTVAINTKFDGTTSGTPVYATGIIGTDLHVTHPVSITYDDALAASDGFLYPPTSTPLQWTPGTGLTGKTIAQALLKGVNHDKVECSSCHDPHKQIGSAPSSGIMVRISGTDSSGRGSTLCRTCHNK